VLLVDAGNSLAVTPGTSKEPPADNGKTSVEILNRLQYDAVSIGSKDLGVGRDELVKRIGEAKTFTFLSANLQDLSTGKLLAKPYIIKKIGGHNVAIIGLTASVPTGSTEFSLVPPVDAVRDYVKKVQSQADIIILLSDAGMDTNQSIAEQVPGISIIISGGDEPIGDPRQTATGTLIVQADQSIQGEAGRSIGVLKAQFDPMGHLTQHNWQSTLLDSSIADDPDMAAWAASLPKQPAQ